MAALMKAQVRGLILKWGVGLLRGIVSNVEAGVGASKVVVMTSPNGYCVHRSSRPGEILQCMTVGLRWKAQLGICRNFRVDRGEEESLPIGLHLVSKNS